MHWLYKYTVLTFSGFFPVFSVFDQVTDTWKPFEGKYTLKIVGGNKYSDDNIQMYTDQQIFDFNNANAWVPTNILLAQ